MAGVTIVTLTGENGLLGKVSTSAQSTDKKSTEEKIQIKMQECYVENKGKPTLQQFADYLCDDDEVEYVSTKKKVASIAHIEVGEAKKIYVKLKEYNYEIEISDNIEIGTVKEITGKPKESKETDAGTTHMTGDSWTATVPTDNWFSNEEYYSTDWDGEGTEEKPYLIQMEEELAGLSYKIASGEDYFSGKYFKLTNDLSMGKHIWIPIGGNNLNNEIGNYYISDLNMKFSGTFDGDNHIIKGIYYNYEEGSYVGLFGCTNGTIKNIFLEDSFIFGNRYIGSIVGHDSRNQIINCKNSSVIKGHTEVGGIVGYEPGTLKNCSNTGYIYCIDSVVGGLIGSANALGSYITNCYNAGVVECGENCGTIGGLVGSGSIYMKNCYNIGDVRANVTNSSKGYYIGGIVGYKSVTDPNSIYNVYNAGKILVNGTANTMYVGAIQGDLVDHTSNNLECKLGFIYNLKNSEVNPDINLFGRLYLGNSKSSKESLSSFPSVSSTTFTYEYDTSETSGYSGNLLTKLNKWVTDNQTNSTDYSTWKMDENDDYPVFSWQ